jgi:hypothetical protein
MAADIIAAAVIVIGVEPKSVKLAERCRPMIENRFFLFEQIPGEPV